MKRILSIALVLCLLTMTFAMADSVSLVKTDGFTTSAVKKSTPIGSNATVSITANSGNHSMYYQVRNGGGTAMTPSKNSSTSSGTVSLAYNYDGYGESLGRTGYSYYLRIAHRSQCTCGTGTVAKVGYTWAP